MTESLASEPAPVAVAPRKRGRRRKLSDAARAQLVERVATGELSGAEAARLAGVSEKTVARWRAEHHMPSQNGLSSPAAPAASLPAAAAAAPEPAGRPDPLTDAVRAAEAVEPGASDPESPPAAAAPVRVEPPPLDVEAALPALVERLLSIVVLLLARRVRLPADDMAELAQLSDHERAELAIVAPGVAPMLAGAFASSPSLGVGIALVSVSGIFLDRLSRIRALAAERRAIPPGGATVPPAESTSHAAAGPTDAAAVAQILELRG